MSGNSMYPTLEDGDYLLVNSFDNEFHRGEVVVFYNESLEKLLIKRVVAVPGDTVCTVNGDVYIKKYGETEFSLVYEPYVRQPHRTFRSAYLRGQDMEAVTVGEGSVFVLGDNRTDSYDSRGFGAVPVDSIVGSVSEFVIYWRYPLQFLYRMF
ncbi:MAG: signal peptidase I [Clostridia bacterium]|nr:signal peptidase I [Clostridia bacterium]